MARLNKERQEQLEPERIRYAKEQIEKLGYTVTGESKTYISFEFKGHPVKLFPYSGWHTGKTIQDGRGLKNLLDQIK